MRKVLSGITLLILSLILISCGDQRQEVKILVVETSDVHGAIFSKNTISGEENGNSLSHVSSLVNSYRETYGDNILLLDNGDLIQGDPASYYSNFIDTTSSHLFSRALNYMGYEAATIGNHDIEAGHSVYDKVYSELEIPWLAANAIDSESGEPYFQAYTLVEKQGVRIAILGLITPAIPRWLPPVLYEGMVYEDMVESAGKWMKEVEKEEPDFVIGLFHSGAGLSSYGNDYPDGYIENASADVAHKVAGFDLILVGHDHHGWNMKLEGPDGDSVLIMGTTSKARDVALASLNCTPVPGDAWDIQLDGWIEETSSYGRDTAFDAHFSADYELVRNFVLDTLCQLDDTIFARDAMFGPSAMTNLVHQAQLEISGAAISFTSPLSSRAVLERGPMTMGDLFHLYRYENMLYLMELSGQEIDGFLEHAVNGWFNTMRSAEDDLLAYARDEEGNIKYRYGSPSTGGPYYNYASAEGIRYTLDLNGSEGDRIHIISLQDGSEFHMDALYKVAVNSYRGSGGGGHLTKGAEIPAEDLMERVLWTSDHDLRYLMADWLREKGTVYVESSENWSIIPESWYLQAKQKDLQYWK